MKKILLIVMMILNLSSFSQNLGTLDSNFGDGGVARMQARIHTDVTSGISNFWTPDPSLYANNMTVIANVNIDGIDQVNPNLELGAFCGDEVRGSILPQYVPAPVNRYEYFLMIYGNSNDNITFKLYDHGSQSVVDLDCQNNISFEVNGTIGNMMEPYDINFTSDITQSTALTSGWNWYSSYIDVEGAEGLNMMKEALGTSAAQIKNQTAFVDYASIWFGTLTATNLEEMYMIKMNEALIMETTGPQANPADNPITLGTNWNWIGYPVSEEMSVNDAFVGVNPANGDYVKSQVGFAQYYEGLGWMGTLNTMNPGQGYMYQNTSGNTKVFIYNDDTYITPPTPPTPTSNIKFERLNHDMQVEGEIQPGRFEIVGDINMMYEMTFDMQVTNTSDEAITLTCERIITSEDIGSNYMCWGSCFSPAISQGDLVLEPGLPNVFNAHFAPIDENWNPIPNTEITIEYHFYERGGEHYVFEVYFKYDPNAKSKLRANITSENNHWVPNSTKYPTNMTMIAVVDGMKDYEVAAFCNGEVRGSARPIYVEQLDSYMLFLTIYGEENDEISFRYFDLNTEEETELIDVMNYGINATIGDVMNPHVLNFATLNVDEMSSNLSIYPNPVEKGGKIYFGATCEKVEIYNTLGVKIYEYENVNSIEGIETSGVYVVKAISNGNVSYSRIIVR